MKFWTKKQRNNIDYRANKDTATFDKSVVVGTTATVGTGLTVTSGGATVTAGGVTVTAGDITANSAAGNLVKSAGNGCSMQIKVLNAAETPNTANATHTCTVALIPAGSLVLGVTARCLGAVLTGSETWSLGVSGATTRYGTTIARASGTTTTLANHLTSASPIYYASETAMVMTGSSGNWGTGTGGNQIRVCIYYISVTAPTS